MSPLALVMLVLLIALFVGDLLLSLVHAGYRWTWKAYPAAHVIVAVVLFSLMIVFNTLKV